MKPCLNILIGVAGAGKSTIAKQITETMPDCVVICPDTIREELCDGNRGDQSRNAEVWEKAYLLVEDNLKLGNNVMFDSTMVNPSKRSRLISMGKKYNYEIVAVVVERDLDTIKRQNANRVWKVPERIIENMYNSFVPPCLGEGFDIVLNY